MREPLRANPGIARTVRVFPGQCALRSGSCKKAPGWGDPSKDAADYQDAINHRGTTIDLGGRKIGQRQESPVMTEAEIEQALQVLTDRFGLAMRTRPRL
jgi:hypothetical protein